MATKAEIIDRLNALSSSIAVGEPGDMLSVRESAQSGYRYEVYAGGYPLNMQCRTAREAEQCIRDNYRELAEQLRDGTATPICRIGN